MTGRITGGVGISGSVERRGASDVSESRQGFEEVRTRLADEKSSQSESSHDMEWLSEGLPEGSRHREDDMVAL